MVGYVIDFEPIGRRGEVDAGQSILEAARRLGVDLVNLCGGGGTCGRCKVQVLEGKVSEPTAGEQEHLTQDELGKGCRLACQAYPSGDCKVHVPPESLTAPQRTQVEGLEVARKISKVPNRTCEGAMRTRVAPVSTCSRKTW